MQNDPNGAKNTVWITVVSIAVIIILIWGAVYMYNNRPSVGGENDTESSMSTSTRWNLGEDDREITAEERAAVSAQAQARVNDLSIKKPAKGKSFNITMVTIEVAGRAIVEYTDGVTEYTAVMSYTVDSQGNISVVSFEILEK